MTQLRSHVVTPFGTGGGGLDTPVIEEDPSLYNDAYRHFLVFPSAVDKVTTDIGRVELGTTKIVTVDAGVVTYRDSDVALLPKLPYNTTPTLEVLFAFDSEGSPITPGASCDPETGQIRLTARCHAAVSYSSFQVLGRKLTYYPKTETLPAGVTVVVHAPGTRWGVLAAFYNGNLTLFEISSLSFNYGNDEIEVYRIISEKVLTPDGQFEKPPGYPQDGNFSGLGFGIDTATSIPADRVHEIGFMDSNGRAWTKEMYVPNLHPYIGALNYKPVKVLKESPVPKEKYGERLVLRAKEIIAARGRGVL